LFNRINAVRSAIGDSGELQRLIKTLPRRGLRFVGAVREEECSPAEAGQHVPDCQQAVDRGLALVEPMRSAGSRRSGR
jgi:DNA-binding winged helix-turn-helix (wHTH) protein